LLSRFEDERKACRDNAAARGISPLHLHLKYTHFFADFQGIAVLANVVRAWANGGESGSENLDGFRVMIGSYHHRFCFLACFFTTSLPNSGTI
jgi:hypothetical protein